MDGRQRLRWRFSDEYRLVFAVPERDPIFTEHVHDYDELIGFYGSDPDNPYDLGASSSFSVNGESPAVNALHNDFPPGGNAHNPMLDPGSQDALSFISQL